MITLVQFPPGMGVPNMSSFCVKGEVLLKMSGQPFEVELEPDPRKGPMDKLPAIRDSDKVIGDSALIRAHLETEYGVDFDAGLSAAERAASHAFCRMLEERTYWAVVYSRWIEPGNWALVRDFWFGSMPPVVRNVMPALIQRGVRKTLHGHGLGRHTREQIYAFGAADIAMAADWLGDKPFFMGDQPTAADATVFGIVVNLLDAPLDGPLKDAAKSHDNLVAYNARCRERWYPDGTEIN